MSSSSDYYGWPNKASWYLYSWLTAESARYQSALDLAETLLAGQSATAATGQLADQLRQRAERECLEGLDSEGLAFGLLSLTLDEVDWGAVAQAFVNEVCPPDTSN